MLIHPKFIYVHLPKTGGSYVEKCLSTIFKEAQEVEGKHISIREVVNEIPGKITFGNIRNPFDWYVSRFFYAKTANSSMPFHNYDLIGQDFKNFIRHMTNSEYQRKHENVRWERWSNLLNDRIYLPVFEYMSRLDIGLYSFEYIYSFFSDYDTIFKGEIDVFENHDALISIQHCIKREELTEELIKLLRQTNIISDPRQEKAIRNIPPERVNKHPDSRDIFDSEMIRLIRHKDRLIFDNYYQNESLSRRSVWSKIWNLKI